MNCCPESEIDVVTGGRMIGHLMIHHQSLQLTSSAWQPFVPAFTGASRHWQLFALRKLSVKAGIGILLLGVSPRLGGLLLGVPMLFQILVYRNFYSTAGTLQALLALHLALTRRRDLAHRLGIQYAMVYGCAALNKLRMPDWRHGRAMAYFLTDLSGTRLVLRSAILLRKAGFRRPRHLAGKLFSWLAISYEIILAMLYLLKCRKSAAALSLVFHIMSVVLSRGGVAWVYVSHALTQAAFFLPAPGASMKKPGGILKGLLWLGVGFVVMETHRFFRRRYLEVYRATPTLKKAKKFRHVPETVQLCQP